MKNMDKKEEISKKYWEEKEFSYFSHRKCEFFPCHKNADGNNFIYFAIVLFILWAISVVAILGIWIMGLRIAAIVCILILRRITERLWSDLVKS